MEGTNDLGQDFSTPWCVWHAYNAEPSHSWQERLGLLGLAIYEASRARQRDLHEQRGLCEQIGRSDPEAARRLSNHWDDQLFAAVEFGTRLGYALAKTWPDGLEGLEDWLGRAKALAEFADPADPADVAQNLAHGLGSAPAEEDHGHPDRG